jgi:hypothetical protein
VGQGYQWEKGDGGVMVQEKSRVGHGLDAGLGRFGACGLLPLFLFLSFFYF